MEITRKPVEWPCPKCEGKMELVYYDRVELDRCTNCGGLWFQPAELQALRDDIWMADYILDTGDKKQGKVYNATKEYDCPECAAAMLMENDKEQPHITYETCPNGHGTFLDAGEFTDLVRKTFWDKFKRAR
jgi:Zn-finger nucleic acid-binding protein